MRQCDHDASICFLLWHMPAIRDSGFTPFCYWGKHFLFIVFQLPEITSFFGGSRSSVMCFSKVQESASSLWVSNVRRHFDTMSIVGSYNSHLCSQSDDRPFSRLLAVSKAAKTSDSATHGLWFVSLPTNLVSRQASAKLEVNCFQFFSKISAPWSNSKQVA